MRKVVILLVSAAFAGLLSLPVLAAEPAAVAQQKTTTPEIRAGSETIKTTPETPAKPILPVPVKPEPAVKIGYVDMAKIANDSAPGKAAYADIKARTAKFKSQIETKQKQLEKQKADIEAKIQTLTPQQRNTKAKEFQKKLEGFQKFVQKAQKDLQAREAELLGKLYKTIEKVAGDYGKANGYAAVVAKRELLFIGDNVEVNDITDEIIRLVNAEHGKK